mgnify:CR=1 FL=1
MFCKVGHAAALELSTTNIQMELAPTARQSGYFAIAAATIGITGALGTYSRWHPCRTPQHRPHRPLRHLSFGTVSKH